MNQQPSVQTVSRRQKITRASSVVFIAVAIAAVIVMFSVISIRFLWERKSYNDRVINAKTAARDQINQNLDNLNKLSDQFSALETSASTNTKTILHALPPTYDYPALATTVESLAQLSGVEFTGTVGEDSSSSAILQAPVSQPVPIPLTLEVTGSYPNIVSFVNNLERSIRPMHVDVMSLSGTNSSLKVTIEGRTYYQPARSLDVSKSEVQ